MPALEVTDLHDTAVLWAKTGSDWQGDEKLASPVEIACNWEDTDTQGVSPEGVTIGYSASVIVKQSVPMDSLMMLGTLTDLAGTGFDADNPRVMQVKSIRSLEDLKGRIPFRSLRLVRYRGTLPAQVG